MDRTADEDGTPTAQSPYPTATTVEDFTRNVAVVRERIARAATGAGREAERVRLLPVSKTVPEERVRQAVAAGLTHLGENKVQEALRKSQDLADLPEVTWAVIGHLQTNKAKYVARFASEFQALASERLAAALDRRLELEDRTLEVFVQVNTSAEDSKFGLPPEEVEAFLTLLPAFPRLKVRGLMTLAVFSSDTERVRSCFVRLRELRDRLRHQAPDGVGLDELSMGMSGDYPIAVEEGATVVRVGQAIFGARALPDRHYWPSG